MREYLEHIDWGAVAMAFLFAYAAPVLLACVIHPTLWLFAFWLLAPFAAGYLAARFARKVPLIHGLAVAVVGLVIFAAILPPQPFVFWLFWGPVNIYCSIYGARMWRQRNQRA